MPFIAESDIKLEIVALSTREGTLPPEEQDYLEMLENQLEQEVFSKY